MTRISRRSLVLGAASAPFVSSALAQSPAGNITKIVVPFPPGGTVDPIARMVQPGLQQRLNTTIIIENKAGASGSIGAAQVAKSPPDGSNWVFVFDTHAVNPLLQSLPFDTEKDLDPVLLIGTAPNIVSTHPSRPFNSFADVVAAAKAKPDTITYASIGSGSLGHLTGVLLSQRAGIKLVHVPYRGGGPAVIDAIAGHVDMLIASAALVTPQVKGGRLRALAQTGKTRISAAGVPTASKAVCRLRGLCVVGIHRRPHAQAVIEPFQHRAGRDPARARRQPADFRESPAVHHALAGPEERRFGRSR